MLEVVNRFAKMDAGDEMEIIGDEIDVYEDLKIILPAADYELISEAFEPPWEGRFRIVIRKTTQGA